MEDPEWLLGKVFEGSGHDVLRANSTPSLEMVSETAE
jgi:hypothetical protein